MSDDLFGWKPPAPKLMTEPRSHRDVETSQIAAASMRKCSGPMQMRIARYIGARGPAGANYDEVVATLKIEKPTAAGRLNDLSEAGFIEARGKRKTRSGRPAKIYFLTDAGKQLIGSAT